MMPAVRRGRWLACVAVAGGILALDHLTGPYIQFPILYVLPVAWAVGMGRVGFGVGLSVVMPLCRALFWLTASLPWGVTARLANAGIQIVVLVSLAWLTDRFVRQRRRILVLEQFLPICSFCKRIQDEKGEWRPLEEYMHERSEVQFTHGCCPECGARHYEGFYPAGH